MNMSTKFTQLALAGIASGLLSTAALADEMKGMDMPAKKDTAAHAKPMKKGKKAAKVKADSTSMPMNDSASVSKAGPHDCKGHNECKGMGNCAVSEKDLKVLAAKAGIPLDKAGKAHDCKGMNACKGLGGGQGGM